MLTAIQSEQERLYESTSLRDDLNDAEAKLLLKWGEGQIERLAQAYPDNFEKQCRFLRQLLKNINRFVGQREFNDEAGQREYLGKAVKYLEPLGWDSVTADQIMARIPDDATDMNGTLQAVLNVLDGENETATDSTKPEPTPPETESVAPDAQQMLEIVLLPDSDRSLHPNLRPTEVIPALPDFDETADSNENTTRFDEQEHLNMGVDETHEQEE